MSSSSRSSLSKKRYTDFCSTPVLKKIRKLSASESTIGTHSSSSTKGTNKEEEKVERDQGKVKKKKKLIKKRQIKKKKTKEESKKNSTSDWETTCIYNETLSRVNDPDKDALYKDLSSPEHVREAPLLVQDFLESPTLRPARLPVESPGKIIFEEKDIPSKDLPSVDVPLDDTDDEETPFLRRESVVKSYLGIRDKKRSKKEVRIDKAKQWLVEVSAPTTSSDLLWDKFVKDNFENVREYLAPPSDSKQKSSMSIYSKERAVRFKDSSSSTKKKCNCKDEHAMVHEFGLHIPENMNIVRGQCNRSSKNWVRTDDVYNFPQSEDEE